MLTGGEMWCTCNDITRWAVYESSSLSHDYVSYEYLNLISQLCWLKFDVHAQRAHKKDLGQEVGAPENKEKEYKRSRSWLYSSLIDGWILENPVVSR